MSEIRTRKVLEAQIEIGGEGKATVSREGDFITISYPYAGRVTREDDPKTELLFGGRVQKMASVLAAMTTAAFNRALLKGSLAEYADRLPHFDARVFGLPNKAEATNCILWREQDATKNAISMAARHYYSPKELHGKSGAEMQEMLFAQGVNFNDYPAFFKRGQFFRRVVGERLLTPEERERIPEKHRPPVSQKVTRSWVAPLEIPKFSAVVNREDVIFEGAAPASVGRNPKGGDREDGLRAEHEHAVTPKAADAQDTPKQSSNRHTQ